MSAQKIIGLILIIIGISIIAWTVYESFNIFTAKKEAPQIFLSSQQDQTSLVGNSIDAQIQKMIGSQISNLLPANSISKLLNLLVWGVFAWILFSAGGHISGIGIKLLKNESKPKES